MLQAFRRRRRNREVVDRLWQGVVDRARDPARFTDGGLPDTVLGRFESLALESFLVLRRCAGEPRLEALSQDLVDRFMTDLDHSMRELGVGYLAVPKRMRKLAGRFYARVEAFGPAVEADDAPALAEALRRTAFADAPGGDPAKAGHLAGLVLEAERRYRRVPAEAILDGILEDPQDIRSVP